MPGWLDRFDPIAARDQLDRKGHAIMRFALPSLHVPKHTVPYHQIDLHLGRAIPIEIVHGDDEYSGTYRTGDLIYSVPNMVCEATWSGQRDAVFCTLSPDFVRRVTGIEPSRGGVVPTVPQSHVHDPLIEQLGRSLLEGSDVLGGEADDLYLDSLAAAMAARLVQRFGEPTAKMPSSPIAPADYRLRRAISFIMDNRTTNPTLAEIADSAGLSVAYFSRSFRNATGRTPHEFLNAARIEDAKRLVADTDHSGSEIAYTLGFSSQSHLIRIFRQHEALTPADYRKRFSRRRTIVSGQNRTKRSD